MKTLRICTVALTLLVSACSSHSRSIRPETVHHKMMVKPGGEGEEVTYTLTNHREGVPRITRSVERSYKLASLGVTGKNMEKNLSDSTGLKPWRGILVSRVSNRSAAARSGIQEEDVLLTYDGAPLATTDQLKKLIQETSTPGDTVPISLLRKSADGRYTEEPMVINATLDGVDARETTSDTILLDSDRGVYKLTGLQVGGLSEQLTTEMYGNKDSVVLIADALVGSPAYLAGFRTGDKVLRCDGQPVTSYRDISRAVWARSSDLKVGMELFGEESREGVVPTEGPLELVVEGPLGRHEGQIVLRDDMFDSSSFNIPIVFDCDGNIQRSRWSFLDFIFQFGANYRSKYRPSPNRQPAEDTFLSFFPLGMFEFESTESYDKYCFLWFIEFTDRH